MSVSPICTNHMKPSGGIVPSSLSIMARASSSATRCSCWSVVKRWHSDVIRIGKTNQVNNVEIGCDGGVREEEVTSGGKGKGWIAERRSRKIV